METSGDFNVDDFLAELTEISVGSAILGLRRINIERRKIVEKNPDLAPMIDGILEHVEAMAGPASAVVGAVVAGIGDAVSGEQGEQLAAVGQSLADIGPQLLRLSGLTKRS